MPQGKHVLWDEIEEAGYYSITKYVDGGIVYEMIEIDPPEVVIRKEPYYFIQPVKDKPVECTIDTPEHHKEYIINGNGELVRYNVHHMAGWAGCYSVKLAICKNDNGNISIERDLNPVEIVDMLKERILHGYNK